MKKPAAPQCSPTAAVAYARYSSAGQRDVSIEQQLKDIREYARRQGLTIVHEYADHAKSGFRHIEARTEFNRMMNAARAGKFAVVIVWKTDRFARSREDAAVFKGHLRRAGVRVLSAMEPIPEGSAGILLEGMLEATAEWYSKTLSENVIRGLADNARKCLWNGNRVYGYGHAADGTYVINEEEAAIVRQIFALYCAGWSAANIAKQLNGQGVTNARGHKWALSGVLNAVGNERYTGVYIYSGHRIEGGMPAIISREEWEEAQKMRKKTSKHYETGAVDYLLTGKAFCGHCGAAMVGDCGTSKTGARYYYYTCQAHKARKGCDKHSVPKQYLEDTVMNYIMDHVLTPEEMDRIADVLMEQQKKRLADSPLPALKAELKEVDDQIDALNDAIAQRIWSKTTVVKLKSLEEQADALREHIEELKYSQDQLLSKKRILFFLHRFAAGDREDPVHREFIIRSFVNAVYVFDDYIKLVVNEVEGNARIPLESLSSDDDQMAGQTVQYPNSATAVYRIELHKKRA